VLGDHRARRNDRALAEFDTRQNLGASADLTAATEHRRRRPGRGSHCPTRQDTYPRGQEDVLFDHDPRTDHAEGLDSRAIADLGVASDAAAGPDRRIDTKSNTLSEARVFTEKGVRSHARSCRHYRVGADDRLGLDYGRRARHLRRAGAATVARHPA